MGVLTGNYAPGAPVPEGSRATTSAGDSFMGQYLETSVLEAVQQLRPIAEEAGCTMAQFAIAWVLRRPEVTSAIVGASRPEQVDDNAAASGLSIDPALFARAEAALEKVRVS